MTNLAASLPSTLALALGLVACNPGPSEIALHTGVAGADAKTPSVQCESAGDISGAAGFCAVLQTGGHKVDMSHGDPTGVYGDLCLGPESELSMSGGQVVTGTVFHDPMVDKLPDDRDERANAVVEADMSATVAAAEAGAAAAEAEGCDLRFDKLKIEGSATWDASDYSGGDGRAVVCVDETFEVKGSDTVFTLSGDVGESWLFKIGGAMKVNGAWIEAGGALDAGDISYLLVGGGKDVAFSGGGGGLGCCKAAIDGSIIALQRKVKLSPGRVNGQIVSGKDISLSSGSLVTCEGDTPVEIEDTGPLIETD